MKHIKTFQDFVNEGKQSYSDFKDEVLNSIKKLDAKKHGQIVDAMVKGKKNDRYTDYIFNSWENRWPALKTSKGLLHMDESNQSEPVNEAIVSGITVYEIASPAPVGMLMDDIEDKMGKRFPYIRSEVFTSPDGLESILAFNLSAYDIKKIKEIGDILIYKMDLTNRKEI